MSTLLKFSEAASLALHATAIIAGWDGDQVSAGTIAGALGASQAHLSKVLMRLVRDGLVKGTPGPGGGFRLTKPPEDVTLRDVYEAIEGPLVTEGCLLGVPACGKKTCILAGLCERVGTEVSEKLSEFTLADFRLSIAPRR
jgi:Rrf2 family protein